MDNLPTLEQIKRQAKKLHKTLGITHTEALEIIAKQYGFANWMNCRRTLKKDILVVPEIAPKLFELSFTDWLKKHVKRDSPLGDLASDMSRDKSWPSYKTLDKYRDYLDRKNAAYEAVATLENAWKTYTQYIKRKNPPAPLTSKTKKVPVKNIDDRNITFVKNVTPIPYRERSIEKFDAGDRAWISWNGSKAIPVTVLEVDERDYRVTADRPLNKAGKYTYSLRLDEVRSTPELACLNMVT